MTPRHDRNRRARLQRLGHDPAFQCPGPLATLGAIGASLSVRYAIGGHFRFGLCHPPIIAPSDDQRQAPFTARLPVIVDRLSGKTRPAQIFVAVLGASNFTYAEASWTQALADWIGAHI